MLILLSLLLLPFLNFFFYQQICEKHKKIGRRHLNLMVLYLPLHLNIHESYAWEGRRACGRHMYVYQGEIAWYCKCWYIKLNATCYQARHHHNHDKHYCHHYDHNDVKTFLGYGNRSLNTRWLKNKLIMFIRIWKSFICGGNAIVD